MERSKIIKSIQSLEKTENVVKYELIDTVSENRIQNAIQCYAPTCKREEIVAMVDTTLRKNGKKGMLITTECIYGSAFSDSPIVLEGLKAVECSKGAITHPVLIYQDDQFRDTGALESIEIKKISPLLKKIIKKQQISEGKKWEWQELHNYYSKDLRTVVEKAVNQFSFLEERLKLRESVDQILIDNAIESYAQEFRKEDVIAIWPEVYTNGKKGCIITEYGIYTSYENANILFDGLLSMAISEQYKEYTLLYYEDQSILRNYLPMARNVRQEFLNMLREIVDGYKNIAKLAQKGNSRSFSVINGWKAFQKEWKGKQIEAGKNSIFISSTFIDMHYERDLIHERVLPMINEVGEAYGQQITFCDLRWGVNTGELDNNEGAKKILSVCMDEIERCRPYMIVILGERYGWIPEQDLIRETTKRYPELDLEELEQSVTALEIEFGALSKEGQLGRTLFYFREMKGTPSEQYRSEGTYHAKKLQQLKARINQIACNKVKSYQVEWDAEHQRPTGFDTFVQMVTDDLKQLMLEDWEKQQEKTAYEKELELHWKYAERNAMLCQARDRVLLMCMEAIRDEKHLITVNGKSGCGKSVLMGALATVLRLGNAKVLPIFCGYTKQSDTASAILQSMVCFLEEQLRLKHRLYESEEEWILRLEELVQKYAGKNQKIVFVLDAIDQLQKDSMRDELKFLPKKFSDSVYVVISCRDTFELPYVPVKIEIPLFNQEERMEAVAGILESQRRELSTEVIEKMIKKQGAGNPLYLQLLVQRLVMMNQKDYEAIADQGGGMDAITAHQYEIVSSSPEQLEKLCAKVLEDGAERIGEHFVKEALACIACSKYGLRENDLRGILGAEGHEWSGLDFSLFLNYMRSLFRIREDGRYDFSHKMVREGLEIKEQEQYKKLADWMKQLPEGDPVRQQEFYYQCYQGKDAIGFWSYFQEYQEYKDVLNHAAQHLAELCQLDQGGKLIQLCAEGRQNGMNHAFLKFVCYYLHWEIGSSKAELLMEKALLQECLIVAKHLLETDKSLEMKRTYSVLHYRIGDVCRVLNEPQELQLALSYLKEGANISRELLALEPTERANRDLAMDLRAIGKVYILLGGAENTQQALKYLQESVTMFERQVKESDTESKRIDLGNAYLALADVYYDLENECEQEKTYYLKCLQTWESFLAENTSDKIKDKLAIVYEKLGDWYAKQADHETALEYFQKTNVLLEERVTNKKTTENVRSWMINWIDLGVSYQCLEEERYHMEAIDCYRKGIDLLQFLIYERKEERFYAKLGYTYRNLDELLFKLGGAEHRQEASRLAWECYLIFERLLQEEDSDSRYQDYLTACSDVQRFGHYKSDAASRLAFREKWQAALEEMYRRTKDKKYKKTLKTAKLLWKLEKLSG